MQTRSAAKRAAAGIQSTGQIVNSLLGGDITLPHEPQGAAGTSRWSTDTGTKTKDAVVVDSGIATTKRARRTKRSKVTKPPLPPDVQPHGLGKIHTLQHPVTDNIKTEKQEDVPKTSRPSLEATSEYLDSIVLECFHDIIDKAVDSAAEAIIQEASPTATSSPPAPREPHGRALRPRPPKKTAELYQESLLTPETSFAESIDSNRPVVSEEDIKIEKRKRNARRTKANPYGLMPGRTPFPDRAAPTPEACHEVHRILTETHGEFKPPTKIPAPSTSVAGCGEVPDLVDALIRTLISGHTAMANANLAIQDVIAKYGQWDPQSIGAGSIDWNKVRLSDEAEIVHAVKRAGLGPTKGKDIKLILDQVYHDNQERRAAYSREKDTGEATEMRGAQELTQGQKDHQLLKIDSGVLTLDHIRAMSPDEAMLELTKFPGIGVKTASCLVLFCLQQPSFAVDTHVWRFCKWLGWVPPKASRDDTYMHGEVRIPNELKYGLHQLFIRHGKECGRCRSGTVEGTPEWDAFVCPMEHLLNRFDKRKTKVQQKPKKGTKKAVMDSDDEDKLSEEPEASADGNGVDMQPEPVVVDEAPVTSGVVHGDGAGEALANRTTRLVVQLRKRKRVDYADHEIDVDA